MQRWAAPSRSISSDSASVGFTLLELLVVVAVVGLLLAIAVPAVIHVRQSARKTECMSNLHQLAVALQHHDATFTQLPRDNDREWGVLAFLLPEIEQKPLYDSLNPSTNKRTALSAALQPLLATHIALLACPSDPQFDSSVSNGGGRTTYLGPEGLFSKRMTLSDVIDGESQTIAFAETTSEHAWAWPGLGTAGGGPNRGAFSSHHNGGVQVAFCDGQTRFISESVDSATFAALCTPQGREVPGAY